MEVILLKNMSKIGDKYDVVQVKNGYGRNFLIPQGIALIANATNLKKLDDIRAKEQEEEDKKISEYQQMAQSLEGKVLKIGVKAGNTGKIFGSITNVQIASKLREEYDMDIARKKIEMPEEIKEIGTYTAQINFHPQVSSTVDFELIKE